MVMVWTIYSRVGPVILEPAESAMPWIYCYLPIKDVEIIQYNRFAVFIALN